MELPEQFWLSIRHLSSFRNREEYDKYLEIKIKEWNEK